MKIQRLRLAAVLLAALAVTACGGDNNGPPAGQVAIQWRTADFNGDFEASWALEAPELAGPADKKASVIDGREVARKDRPAPGPGNELADIKVVRTVEDDTQKEDFVFVYLRLTEKDGDSDEEVVTLRRVDGVWRVAKWEP